MTSSDRAEGEVGLRVRTNVLRFRSGQKLSYAEISRQLTELGNPIPVLGLKRIERGERRVDVDDLLALAKVLGVDPDALLWRLECSVCEGKPPEGFTCQTCGAS